MCLTGLLKQSDREMGDKIADAPNAEVADEVSQKNNRRDVWGRTGYTA